MDHPYRITIDGPAASGKSTLGRAIAAQLGWPCIDAGLLYRAVTWLVCQTHIHPGDEEACAALAGSDEIQMPSKTLLEGSKTYTISVSGKPVTDLLYLPSLTACVPLVAAHPLVRATVTTRLREMAKLQSVVMIGRDCGTRVLPEAELKIYLTASLGERAQRRYKECCEQQLGEQLPPLRLEQIQEALCQRDEQDQDRLRPAGDAFVLQTDDLNSEQVLDRIANLLVVRGFLLTKERHQEDVQPAFSFPLENQDVSTSPQKHGRQT